MENKLLALLFAILFFALSAAGAHAYYFSASLNGFNAPLGAGARCTQPPVLLASGLSGGERFILTTLSGSLCRQAKIPATCVNSFSRGCSAITQCNNTNVRLGFFTSNNGFIQEFRLADAYNAAGIIVPSGAFYAYAYYRDGTDYYYNNNGAYNCYMEGTVGGVFSVSVFASPSTANAGQIVTFTAIPNGGNGNYTYNWSGPCAGSGPVCQVAFPYVGIYTQSVIVTSGGYNQIASATVQINPSTPSCAPHSYKQCVGNSVYWFNSCGAQEDVFQACSGTQTCSNGSCASNCIPNVYKQCVGNISYWHDSCGNQGPIFQACNAGQTCSNGACSTNCTPNSYMQCVGNILYWYDSCGNQGNIYQTCPNGCSNASCNINNVSATISYSPNPAIAGQPVVFTAAASGGNGTYAYNWTGACAGSGPTCQATFSTPGSYSVSAAVTSGGQTYTANLSFTVSNSQTCVPHSYKQCVGNSVYWFNSCGAQEDVFQACSGTQTCSNGLCSDSCTSHATRRCVGRHAYWFNSCGAQEGIAEDCGFGTCQSGQCILNSFSLSCVANPSQVLTGQTAIFNSFINLPTNAARASSASNPVYIYSWSGACSGNSNTCSRTFANSGAYTANLSVTIGTVTKTASCSINVVSSAPSAAPYSYDYNPSYSFMAR